MSTLGVVCASGLMAGAFGSRQSSKEQKLPVLLGCAQRADGGFEVSAISVDGKPCYRVPLPKRGHGIALSKDHRIAFVFARRPGEFIQVIDTDSGKVLSLFEQQEGRIFYGHGDVHGEYLYTSEGVTETSEGIVGVYKISSSGGLSKVREFSGFGIGPHEIRVVNDTTLAVAVGGIKTRGREKLNIDDMAPALVLLDRENGEIKGRYELHDHQLSIRHMAVTSSGGVVVAQQYKGESEDALPLLAVLSSGGQFYSLNAREDQWQRFNHYIGSVACTDSQIVATSPRGNCFGVWDMKSGELLEIGSLLDASGASADKTGFALSSGSGRLVMQKTEKSHTYHDSDVVWDNHWVML
ncbi:DUF1513 domain-containing protein [Enterovibrio coralii]|uniref:DUF1513 domain-containing protein n=1 Tax=Enterovibrio coralii TaxID=294935 RepID=UPI000AFCB382|nr:DUF1513 domain-containing protein [Enterovibrio coralii]